MPSSATIDVAGVQANLEAAQLGAVKRFFELSTRTLTPIANAARGGWPVGKRIGSSGGKWGGSRATETFGTSRDSIALEMESGSSELRNAIRVGPTHTGWPAYRILWSRYNQQARDEIIAKAGAEKAARANDPAAAARIKDYFEQLEWRKRVRYFGDVPPVGMERKSPFAHLIRQPAKAAAVPLAKELQADLVTLARGG